MTDFFLLLDQPRQPWLEAEKLKETFHEKSRTAHPDARAHGVPAGEAEATFAQLNEAYQVLLNPRRRLQHLLALENQTPVSAGQAVSNDLADLFQSVATASQAADAILRKLSTASNPLSRSLLQPQLRSVRDGLEEVAVTLRSLHDKADRELKALNDSSTATSESRVAELQRLAGHFAYLTRWTSEIDAKRAQLAPY